MALSKILKFSYIKTASEGIKMITLQEFLKEKINIYYDNDKI